MKTFDQFLKKCKSGSLGFTSDNEFQEQVISFMEDTSINIEEKRKLVEFLEEVRNSNNALFN